MSKLYRSVTVVRRLQGEVVVYRCLVRSEDEMVYIQSADRLRHPITADMLRQHEKNFWELMLDGCPEDRSAGHTTVEAAIHAFDADFGNDFSGTSSAE